MKRFRHLKKHRGDVYMNKYIKACQLYCYHFLSNDKKHNFINSQTFGLAISITKSGIPRILPSYLRVGLRSRDPNMTRICLTILSLYRVLPYPGKVKINTITDPFKGFIPLNLISFIPKFLKLLPFPEFKWNWSPFVLSSSGPIKIPYLGDLDPREAKKGLKSKSNHLLKGNSTSGVLLAIIAIMNSSLKNNFKWFFLDAPSPANHSRLWDFLENFGESLVNLPFLGKLARNYPLGQLAFKEEPGKVRVFAMVDAFTQWVLNPLHEHLFKILQLIESRTGTDATFDQDAGVIRLRKLMESSDSVFSFDLSSATDRLPLLLQSLLLDRMSPGLGSNWSSILINRDYLVPKHKTLSSNIKKVKYETGQPMGALSSWAMLALTHHLIVQYAAYQVTGKFYWFKNYLVLGDDIVICDSKVAKQYLSVMKILDVGVNPSKSLFSKIGTHAEFAKRFVTTDYDLSPWSLKEYGSIFSNWAILLQNIKKRQVNLVPFLKFVGFGSKAVGHITNKKLFGFWTNQTVFLALWRTCRLEVQDLFLGLYSHLDYIIWPKLKEYAQWVNTTTNLWRGLLTPLQSTLNIKAIALHLNIPSTVEKDAITRLATHWIRDLYLFSQFKSINEFKSYKGIIPQDLIQKVEVFIYELFWGSGFYEFLCFGRRRDWFDKSSNILVMHCWQASIIDLINTYFDDPKSWLVNSNWKDKACPVSVSHMFKSLPSEDLKLQVVRDMRQLGKSVDLLKKSIDSKLSITSRSLISAPPRRPRFF